MKSHQEIERDLQQIMASPTEAEMSNKMRRYIESLSEDELEYASGYMRKWRNAAEAHFKERQ